MQRIFSLFVAALTAVPGSAYSQGAPSILIELYTSQGCSSSPAADALLSQLSKRDGIIALSLHVDYWDYLGLKDEFARPEHGARQRAYAKTAGARTVYTPELVVQGESRLKGHDSKGVIADIERRAQLPATAEIALARDGKNLLVHLATVDGPVGAADIQLVHFIPSRTVSIEAGENVGREITYINIVTDWRTVGRWEGTEQLDLTLQDVDPGPLAVIVQRQKMGLVLTTASLP